MHKPLTKQDVAEQIRFTRARKGISWQQLAEAIHRDPVWTVAALLGQHPVPESEVAVIAELLELDAEAVVVLQMEPYRGNGESVRSDPTIYRFHEALEVYGSAIKELIHEEFGDGIMSAINFQVSVQRRTDPGGDRVVVVFDGKFLDYAWKHAAQEG
ncbi:cyanase [Amycolatopsis alkalitolerans]|uniref:Cyanate hydratase n=1 Tax=Amycolatopsis alkalitolerans TaxID=2547244 RepID=A0A5C4M6I7_9PSEU|nr:cyanase [Amycolatopsis alkalitolerans]TNC28050.1 cyanase [Amycolatopsis alkalitolerans]